MSKVSKSQILKLKIALEYLLNLTKEQPEEDTFYIDLYELIDKFPSFKNRLTVRKIFRDISKLTHENVSFEIKDFEYTNESPVITATQGNSSQKVIKTMLLVDIDNIEDFEKEYDNICNQINKDDKQNQIYKIGLYKDNREAMYFVLNDNYSPDKIINASRLARKWPLLIRIASGESISLDESDSVVQLYNYFNSNTGCVIYKKSSYAKTKIFSIKNNKLIPEIEIEFISPKIFKQRQNKQI